MSPSTHTLMLNLIQSHANVSFQFIFLLVIYWPICHNSTLGLSSISSPSPESYMPTPTLWQFQSCLSGSHNVNYLLPTTLPFPSLNKFNNLILLFYPSSFVHTYIWTYIYIYIEDLVPNKYNSIKMSFSSPHYKL